jgi:hypothetical protein
MIHSLSSNHYIICPIWVDTRSLLSVFVVLFYYCDTFLVTHDLDRLTFLIYDWAQFLLVYLCGFHKPESVFVVGSVH